MRPVRGGIKLAYQEIELPFEAPPDREQLQEDAICFKMRGVF